MLFFCISQSAISGITQVHACEGRRANTFGNIRQRMKIKHLYYLHWVDDDGERRVVPLTAALLSPASGSFTTAMD